MILEEMCEVAKEFTPEDNLSINGGSVIIENTKFSIVTKIYKELNRRGFQPVMVSNGENEYYIY